MNTTLLIDFDGTLCHDKFWRSLEPILREKVQRHLFQNNKSCVNDWMKGAYTSEDINKKLSDDLGIEYDFLWKTFVQDCQGMKIETSLLEKLKSIRKDFEIILITDNMDCFDRFTVPSLKLDMYFDVIINSFSERALKNENCGQLFKEALRRIGSNLQESILIDNSENSCKLFEDMGGTSYLVTQEKPLVYWLERA